MRMWLKSACVVLAWSMVPIMLVAAVTHGSAPRPAQANTRTQSNTKITLTSTLRAAPATASTPHTRYVVQDGDTLSGIAARFAVRGGWPALYAANRPVIGSDPGTIHPGTVLVWPGPALARYTITAGDTLSGIAARFAVRGGWPALYAANRPVIGPDPGAIRPGTVLTLPRPGTPKTPTASQPAPPRQQQLPAPSASAPAGSGHRSQPGASGHRPQPAAKGTRDTGMPQSLKVLLLAVGLLIVLALLAEPLIAARRRHRTAIQAAVQARGAMPGGSQAVPGGQSIQNRGASQGDQVEQDRRAIESGPDAQTGPLPQLTPRPPGPAGPRIVLADHDRLVVTCSESGERVYVLRPPGQDPRSILRVARLVLPEGPYEELAEKLKMPASWPME